MYPSVLCSQGAFALRYIEDGIGLKKLLTYAVVCTGISDTLIGLLPSYHTAGQWAWITLALCRFTQGGDQKLACPPSSDPLLGL